MFYNNNNQSNPGSSHQLSPEQNQQLQQQQQQQQPSQLSPEQEPKNLEGKSQFADFSNNGSLHPRILYLRRLYFLMSMQYTLVLFIYYFLKRWNYSVIEKIQDNSYILYIFLLGIIVFGVIAMMLRQQIRQFPINILFLLCFYICFVGFWLVYFVRHAEAFTFMIYCIIWLLITSQFFYTLCVRVKLTQQGSTLFIFATLIIVFEAFSIYTRLHLFNMIIVLILGFIFAYLLVLDTQTRVGSEESYDWSGEEPFSGSILVYFDMFGLIVHQFDLLKNLIVSQRN